MFVARLVPTAYQIQNESAMNATIYSSDVKVMLQLFAPAQYQLFVFDPAGRLEIEQEAHLAGSDNATAPKVLVNFGRATRCYQHYNLSEFDVILDYGKCCPTGLPTTRFDYRNNPDGTTRWLYQPNDFSASFLGFYNEGTLRARAAATLIRLLFAVGLGWLFRSGSVSVHHREASKPSRTLANVAFDRVAIFTGTAGPNRTAVFQLSTKGAVTHYAKVALTRLALNNLFWEKRSTDRLVLSLPDGVEAPVATETLDPAMVLFSNIKPAQAKRTSSFTPLLAKSLTALFEGTRQLHALEQMGFKNLALRASGYLRKQGQEPTRFQQLGEKVLKLYDTIDPSEMIYTGLAHGDFTPWNFYVANDRVYLYDWELSHTQMPALYDLFHFCFQ